ncbi:DUF2255 family protein [Salinicola peritrichatus]|uniref:DUF2255 family protein n=1 Tax=Salinicola peritrichatus TaxID=1267424 RepID=UPI000DA26511|nr:DUF2255 family protein [Salinicola peritrichatus]
MSDWDRNTLSRIVEADDLHVAPFRGDGQTPGTPTWIWAIEVDGALYVRAYNGTRSRWYRSARDQGAGQIVAAGDRYDVTFEPIDDAGLNDRIDAAYRQKYADSAYLPAMIGERTRAATIRIRPRQ